MAELYLHQRQVQSVFNLLDEKENDITFSLGWALSRSPSFLRRFLGCLPGVLTVEQEEPMISLQDFKHGAGITDIEIRSAGFYIIAEAKRGWALPSLEQLKKYLPRFEKSQSPVRLLVTMSECSQDYARQYLPAQVDGIQVRHISWSELSSLSRLSGGTNAEKRLMQEFRNYLSTIVNMQPQESNWVYVVSLSYHQFAPGLTFVQVVEERKRYFHPYGGNGWPIQPPNYIAFRYDGVLSSIHHIEKAQVIRNFHPFFREYPDEEVDPHFLYELGPAIRPSNEIKTGNIYASGRVWAMLDLLLTSRTIADARDASKKRAGQS